MTETEKIVAAILAAMLVFVVKEDSKNPVAAVKKYRECCASLEVAQGDAEEEVEKVVAQQRYPVWAVLISLV